MLHVFPKSGTESYSILSQPLQSKVLALISLPDSEALSLEYIAFTQYVLYR